MSDCMVNSIFEKQVKAKLFDQIEFYGENFVKIMLSANTILNLIDKREEVNLPNFSITLNNKINEISNIFKSSGLSLYSSNYLNIVCNNFLGEAIIDDLFSISHDIVIRLSVYVDFFCVISNRLNKISNSTLKRFIFALKNITSLKEIIDEVLTPEEKNFYRNLKNDIISLDNKLYNYNLEDNILSSLDKKLTPSLVYDYGNDYMLFILREIEASFEKLGLSNLIGDLRILFANKIKNNQQLENIILKKELVKENVSI